MKKYAITGGIASGKSTFSKLVKSMKLPFVDCDALVRDAYEQGGLIYEAVVKTFGLSILDASGNVDRKRLGELVFSNPEARKLIDDVTHPIVKALVAKELEKFEAAGEAHAFVDIPLLFETGAELQYDASILIDTDETLQIRRLMKRNHLSEAAAIARIQSQMPLAEKREKATYIITNNTSVKAFIKQSEALLQILLK